MDLPHEWYVAMAKSFGLFWLVAMSIVITLYAFWPSLGGRLRRAADSILDDETGPAGDPRQLPEDEPWR